MDVTQFHFAEDGERLIARPHGRMDADAGDEFATADEQSAEAASKSVTIDLAELDFVSLGAVRAILRLARTLKASDRDLGFAHGSAALRETLHQAGFDHLFAFTPPFNSHHRGTSG